MKFDAVLFDVGKVLLDWDPRHLYLDTFNGDAAATERFLAEVLPLAWILEMDAGKPMAQAVAEKIAAHPQHAERIALYESQWARTVRGAVPGSVEILAELRARNLRLYALTNFSAETWPLALARFDFLGWFEAAVVSGQIGLAKPDPRIYAAAIERCRLDPSRTVFIDDRMENVEAARAFGIHALQFTSAARLRTDLEGLGLL
jgi:2-haloacid dehalogenase